MDEYIQHYLERLDTENAYTALLELDKSAVPLLVQAFREEAEVWRRVILLDVIWRHRLDGTAEFLGEVLQDDQLEIFEAALDGLIALGGSDTIAILEAEKYRLLIIGGDPRVRIKWIDEAMDHIRTGSPGEAPALL